MKSTLIKSFLAMLLSLGGVFGFCAAQSQSITKNSQGAHENLFYLLWKDSGDASISLQAGGRYTSQWNMSTNNWFGGLGWNPGGERVVRYSGEFRPTGGAAYLSLYGWMKNPTIEYYIVEGYSGHNPSQVNPREYFGSYQSDGAIYDVYRYKRVIGLAIDSPIRTTYYSVRRTIKPVGSVSGTITTANHFNAWTDAGLEMGTFDYMILATESYQGRGSSSISVAESCGESNGMPLCCSSDADEDHDSYGEQSGEICLVDPSSSSSSSNSSSSSGSSGSEQKAGGFGMEFLLMVGALYVRIFRRKLNPPLRTSQEKSYPWAL